MDWIFIIFILVVLGGLFIWWKYLRTRDCLSEAQLKYYTGKINKTVTLTPSHGLMEMHKIFITALKDLANEKRGTAAEVTQQYETYFPNKVRIWHYHRLRNRVAHQIDTKVREEEAQTARREYLRALKSLT